jgi:hypothetical protein
LPLGRDHFLLHHRRCALNLVDREDRLTMTVAKLIVEFAKEGERDPNRLRELVMKTLQPE